MDEQATCATCPYFDRKSGGTALGGCNNVRSPWDYVTALDVCREHPALPPRPARQPPIPRAAGDE